MNEAQKLFKEFKETEFSNDLEIINFVQTHLDTLLSEATQDLNDIGFTYIEYIESLYNQSRYSRVLEFIDRIETIEYFNEYRKTDPSFDENIRFYKYASLSRKHKTNESLKGFSNLVLDFPENEDYPDWVRELKYKKRNKILGLIMFIMLGILFISLVIRNFYPSEAIKSLGNKLEILFVISFLGYYANNLISKKASR
ncbi:MAG: hypothetical protein AB7S50_03540 [Bacteroidales bacterium]